PLRFLRLEGFLERVLVVGRHDPLDVGLVDRDPAGRDADFRFGVGNVGDADDVVHGGGNPNMDSAPRHEQTESRLIPDLNLRLTRARRGPKFKRGDPTPCPARAAPPRAPPPPRHWPAGAAATSARFSSSAPCARRASANPRAATRCATPSRPNFSRAAPTSARSRSFSATATWRRP